MMTQAHAIRRKQAVRIIMRYMLDKGVFDKFDQTLKHGLDRIMTTSPNPKPAIKPIASQ